MDFKNWTLTEFNVEDDGLPSINIQLAEMILEKTGVKIPSEALDEIYDDIDFENIYYWGIGNTQLVSDMLNKLSQELLGAATPTYGDKNVEPEKFYNSLQQAANKRGWK